MIATKLNKVKSWSDTLIEFLLSSNEDEKVVDLFKEDILEKLVEISPEKELNWLEVGIGNGSKTLMIAKLLKHFKKVNLTICEPSTDWLNYIEQTYFQSKLPSNINVNIQNKTIEELVEEDHLNDFDFISIIQVMYSPTVRSAIIEYIEKNSFKKPCLIWVDVESKLGDFFKVRQLLNKKINTGVHSCYEELTTYLEQNEIRFDTFFTKNKVCKISKQDVMNNNNHWLFPFIIGNSFEEFKVMNANHKKEAIQIIRDYVDDIRCNVFDIPDVSILIFCE